MPENEFEKKVSSEMQSLKFKPSEKVWLQVEERIRKKKKRRVFLIIFLLAGIGLLGYWQWNNLFEGNENDVTKNEHPVKENNPTDKGTAIQEKSITTPEEKNKIIETTTSEKKNNDEKRAPFHEKRDQVETSKNISGTTPSGKRIKQTERYKTTPGIRQENKIDKVGQANKKIDAEVLANEPIIAKPITPDVAGKDLPVRDTINENKQLPDANGEAKNTKSGAEENKIDTISKIGAEEKEKKINKPDSSKIQPIKDSAAVVKKDNPSKKWKWGLEFTPGISSLNESIFSFDMMKSAADVFANPSTGAGVPIPLSPPSDSRTGFAFQMGAFAQKNMTPRSSFSVGLRYGYYSEHIRVGRDTLIVSPNQFLSYARDNFYQASNSSNNKTNSYHFIEIPIHYHLQLNKNKQKPFSWDAGFSIGRLVATDAVMYDTAFRGIYYKQTNLLNKTQFSLATAFSFTIINNKSIQWRMGPAVDIHLNSLLNSPFEDKKYLFFAGLRSRILFNSKK